MFNSCKVCVNHKPVDIIFSLALLFLSGCGNDDDDVSVINMGAQFQIFDCSNCTHIVSTHETNGEELAIAPGDIICLDSEVEYENLLFSSIEGIAANPIIIRNCGGQAIINSTSGFGIKFKNSSNFKILGDGGGADYGIKVSTDRGFFITFEEFTTDFEIAYVEIAGKQKNGIGENNGFAGFGVKTSPNQACDVFTDPTRQAWIMRNIIVRDNHIHDTGGEGLYIGHGFYKGRKESACTDITFSHSIKNLRVFNNLIENTGFDGIQVKNADEDVEVYDNIIINYGTRNEEVHNEGLFIGEGTTGKFYNNIVINGTGHGIQMQGLGNLNIFNNVVIKPGGDGFFGAHGEFVIRFEDGYFNIFNNTFVDAGDDGFVFFNDAGGIKRVINNIVAGVGENLNPSGATLEMTNNIFTTDINEIGFSDLNANDVGLTSGAPAIDAGADLSSFGVTFDIEGDPRPQGSAFDVGADEF